ncbi:MULTISPECIES: ligase-associated DNA damage response DEXH box helicase [Olivibacter]|uniref:Ligase-associated DNA damage response DEXH box helicase n=1 Tax=Olivibacter jilunii TaxID=985016 RepID=A0ABW6AZE9_9SPHI|nr:ligase-associated DNA damage response DEXH box helicase [Olivibacter sp. UJ_SKK_5.1]MDX3911971.1 ligase-associated DNA damage response DEXH box helicase [Pseudosphingobacterium sp.]
MLAEKWFELKRWSPHRFQKETWQAIIKGASGLLNAPTGYGKTYAMWFGILERLLAFRQSQTKVSRGTYCLWITPLRSLSQEMVLALNRVNNDLDLKLDIALRTGDTTLKERQRQIKESPDVLITTPESIHLMLAQKGYASRLKSIQFVVVDEWHELLGSKRGVLTELGLSKLKDLNPQLQIWGISATIGNLEEAKQILLGKQDGVIIKANLPKKTQITTVLPDVLEKFPWGGHLGIHLATKVLEIVNNSDTTLIFTNTRSQAEIWYQQLLRLQPDLAGILALHHGSLSEEIRQWVEQALHAGTLKAVVCTSSLDLGVDFRPVDTVVQVGSAKGIARFLQRAGRSGHRPGATSKIWFVPTHSLEIMEGAALRYAEQHQLMEDRIPYIRSFDVLIQYLVTLAVSDGFRPQEVFSEIKSTHCFESISWEEFTQCLLMITQGGKTLDAYDEFHKVVIEEGVYKVVSKKVAMRHRLSIGAIVSDTMMTVKYLSGKYIGSIEEWFISRLNPGDTFWFAGKNLELIRVKDLQAIVRMSNKKKGLVPSWMGGRLPLSTHLSFAIRHVLDQWQTSAAQEPEISFLKPLFLEQQRRSTLPSNEYLVVEQTETKEGHHLFFFPFEGKFIHEGMAALIAHRLGKARPYTFSVALNDYGFELLSDQEIDIKTAIANGLFSVENLSEDIQQSVNMTELARKRFRDIAGIAGLVFQGFPGKKIKTKHLQANSGLFFKVFEEYESDNLLLREAYDEVFDFQLDYNRLLNALNRITSQKIIINKTDRLTPFAFPIFAESFRERFSNEALEDRLNKIIAQLE